MQAIDDSQLLRLVRELGVTAAFAAARARAAATTYLWLRERVGQGAGDDEQAFRDRLCSHFAMRGRLRAQRDDFFVYFDAVRRLDAAPTFEEALRAISALTGQVEKSVASQLIALLDPDQPVIDRDVRELLPRYGFPVLGEAAALDECIDYHRSLCVLYTQMFAAPAWPALLAVFEAALGEEAPRLTSARKLHLLLTHSRRRIALMPSLSWAPPQRSGGARREPTWTEAGQAPARVLHLCR